MVVFVVENPKLNKRKEINLEKYTKEEILKLFEAYLKTKFNTYLRIKDDRCN